MNEKSCLLWTLFKVILFLAAVTVVVAVVLKKLDMLSFTHYNALSGEPEIIPAENNGESGVPYTDDQNFV